MHIGRGLNILRKIAILTTLILPTQAANFNISFTGLSGAGQNSSFATLTGASTLNGSGVNTINDPNLTISAEDFIHATTPVDALFGTVNSVLNVTWDYNLAISKLNGTGSGICANGPNCGGLGVAGGTDSNTDALNGNDATHGDEALVFDFGNSVVAANSISFDLRGYNSSGSPTDAVWLFVEFSPSNGSPSDISLLLPTSSNSDTNTIALSALAGLNVTTPVAKIAVLANTGNLAFGRLAYQSAVVAPAPEPQTFAFVGAAILLFALRLRGSKLNPRRN